MMTDWLVIRIFERNETDLKALYLLLSDVEVNKYLPWYPVKNMEETEIFYEKRIDPRVQDESKGYYFAVCLQEDNIPIGYVTVGPSPNYDFGYGLRKDFWGRGIITEASEVVLAFLKEKSIRL